MLVDQKEQNITGLMHDKDESYQNIKILNQQISDLDTLIGDKNEEIVNLYSEKQKLEEIINLKNKELSEIFLARSNEQNGFRFDIVSMENRYQNICTERNTNIYRINSLENRVRALEEELNNERIRNDFNTNNRCFPTTTLRNEQEEDNRVRCVICNDNKTYKGIRGLNIHIGKMHKMNH